MLYKVFLNFEPVVEILKRYLCKYCLLCCTRRSVYMCLTSVLFVNLYNLILPFSLCTFL